MLSNVENLQKIFADMNRNGFVTSAPLQWGFFFFDDGPLHLQSLFNELEGYGYVLESLEERNVVNGHSILTPEQLHKRNIAFNELAEYCSVKLYDGWDVGQIEK